MAWRRFQHIPCGFDVFGNGHPPKKTVTDMLSEARRFFVNLVCTAWRSLSVACFKKYFMPSDSANSRRRFPQIPPLIRQVLETYSPHFSSVVALWIVLLVCGVRRPRPRLGGGSKHVRHPHVVLDKGRMFDVWFRKSTNQVGVGLLSCPESSPRVLFVLPCEELNGRLRYANGISGNDCR